MIESYTSTATAMTTASGHCLPGTQETVGVQGGLDPDAELMARVTAHGDREAFTRLVDRHKDSLVAYLARLTGCGEQAQDLAQESFLRLYRAAAQYKDRGYFRAYLFRIATNLVRSQERKAKRWRRLTAVVSPASPSAPTASGRDSGSQADETRAVGPTPSWWHGGASRSAEGRVLQKERQALLVQAIAALPMKYRTVLVLSEIEELPHREIATLLDCREGTVKSRLHRARQRLRERLEPYWRGSETGVAVGERA